MPRKSATKVTLSNNQERILKGYAAGSHAPLHLKTRAQIVLYAAQGWSNNAIERTMGIDPTTVTRWRDRYGAKHEELQRTETERPLKLRSLITTLLSDEQRPGSPATYTDEKVATIVALACEDPAALGLPFSHWTPGMLQREAIRRGIVATISVRQVGRFLKRKGLTAS